MNIPPVSERHLSPFDLPLTDQKTLRTQYPASTPRVSQLEVSEGVFIHLEEYGNPDGIPVVFVHGGPGSRFRTTDHQWFDPEKYRIILYQQRGTAKCIPSAEDLDVDAGVFKDVTIHTLAEDMETIRKAMGVEKWLVFGGSWGSTLSLYYAEAFPKSCSGLILWGVYLGADEENCDFFNGEKLKESCGKEWDPRALERIVDYASEKGFTIKPGDTRSITSTYRKMVIDQNDLKACRLWTAFENYVDDPSDKAELERVLSDTLETTPLERSKAIWETLMFDELPRSVNLLEEEQLKRLIDVPIHIVQGKKDNVCPWRYANKLVEELSRIGHKVSIDLIESGSHSPYDPDMMGALISSIERYSLGQIIS